MNARSRASAAIATRMALNTRAAGLNLQSFSKIDVIAQSEGHVGSVLRALLVSDKTGHVLPSGNLIPQSAAVSLRSETSDLVDNREVFRAGCEKQVSRKPSFSPACQGKPQAPNSGRLPFCARTGESASCAGRYTCTDPFFWKV